MTKSALRKTVLNKIEHHLAVASSIFAIRVTHGYGVKYKSTEFNQSIKSVISHCNSLNPEATKKKVPDYPYWSEYMALAAYESTKPSPDVDFILECCLKVKELKKIRSA